jgi:hypothetical protein
MKAPLSSLGLACPVLAAPMSGGPMTPALVTAAARAGSLGFLAGGYKTPALLQQQIAEVREQTPTFGVNLFAPNPVPVDPGEFRRYAAAVQAEASQYGLQLEGTDPVENDDAWSAKVDLLVSDPVPVVSFTFGLPGPSVVTALKRAGTLIIQTVTSAGEARLAAEAGADALAVQALAAGGHSGTLTPQRLPAAVPLPELAASVADATGLPVVAAGGRGRGDGRDRAAAQRRERRVGRAPGGHRRSRTRADRAHPGFQRASGPGPAERVHREVLGAGPARLPGAALPDQPAAQGRDRGPEPRTGALVGGHRVPQRGHRAGHDDPDPPGQRNLGASAV